MTRDVFARRLPALALLSALAACSANAASSFTPSDAAGNAHALRPFDKSVGGVIKDEDWVVPKGETLTVEPGGLTVFAKNKITIEGTLKVDPGSRIAFFAKSFDIHLGRIDSIPTPSGSRTAIKPATDVISACTIVVGRLNDSPGYAQLIIPSGDSLYLSANGKANCNVRSYTGLGLDAGRTGTFALPGLRDGEPGGNLEIGTLAAISIARHVAREGGVVVQAYAAGYVLIANQFFGASGGTGGYDYQQTSSGLPANALSFAPGNGGRGGNIAIDANTLDAVTPLGGQANAGSGGFGGTFGYNGSFDGTATSPNGENLSIAQSSGGNGGSVTVKAGFISSLLTLVGGNGGPPGPVSAAAGNGYSNSPSGPGPIGNGGNVTLSLGQIGKAGTGPTNGVNGTFPEMTFTGGGGGTPSTCCPSGGLGASFTVTRNPRVPPLPNGVTITLDGFGTGGYGGLECGMAAGGGGNGGQLYDIAKDSVTVIDGSFDGGDGGSGTPPGAGGQGGTDHYLGTPIGLNGQNGATC